MRWVSARQATPMASVEFFVHDPLQPPWVHLVVLSIQVDVDIRPLCTAGVRIQVVIASPVTASSKTVDADLNERHPPPPSSTLDQSSAVWTAGIVRTPSLSIPS